MIDLKQFETAAGWLLVLGGVALGLEGLMNYDLLASLLGFGSTIGRVLDIAIGVAAVLMAYKMLKMGKK